MSDQPIFERINELSTEEEQLWQRASDGSGLSPEETQRLAAIKVELDRCYDLLHQRLGRLDAGLDPEDVELRPADVVERYQQ